MNSIARLLRPVEIVEEAETIADFVRGYSIEATRPTAEDVAALADSAPKGTMAYIGAVRGRAPQDAIESAVRLRRGGFEPVPHVAARAFATMRAADDFIARMAGEAGVRRVLAIGGDTDPPAGAQRSAIELIDCGLLQRYGIAEVGIAGYPEGHPQIPQQGLDRALAEKIAAAEQTGLRVHIVTQFCFDAAAIQAWIRRLRAFGFEHPVRIGLAGPTSMAELMRYARRCGVRASVQGLARHAGLLRNLFSMSAPDSIIRTLAEPRRHGEHGGVRAHFFTFGGLARTARWADAVGRRHIALEAGQGFRVEPAS